jgi:GAF domain-containing protein
MCRVDAPQHKPSHADDRSSVAKPADAILQQIAQAAAQVADAGIGLVTFLDEKTQWIIARFGWEAESTSREAAFCAWAVHNAEVMWVEDAQRDDRFRDNPYVQGEPNVRFYAGAPLSAEEGARIGTVCVLDKRPRSYDPELAVQVQGLAARASEHLRVCATVPR